MMMDVSDCRVRQRTHLPTKLPTSFNSGRWQSGYNPDLIFASGNISPQCTKSVCRPIPKTQHRPIMCQVLAVVQPVKLEFRRRFNFGKADSDKYSAEIDEKLLSLKSAASNYDKFIYIIRIVSCQTIPRGCRTNYMSGLNTGTAKLLGSYERQFPNDPFSAETIQTGADLMEELTKTRRKIWENTVANIDMTHKQKCMDHLTQVPHW